MIRISRILVVLFLMLAIVLSSTAWAGDSDGVTGYSIRLKNKDFSTGDDNNGAPGGSVVYAPQETRQGVVPGVISATKPDYVWLTSMPLRFVLFTFWVR